MKKKVCKCLAIFWSLFVGIGALVGGICMLIEPDGSIMQMQWLLPYFQVLPFADKLFADYVFSGIMLIIVNGITNAVAFVFLLKKEKVGGVLCCVFGFTLMLWIIIQFVIFPPNAMDIIFFLIGFAQCITGYACFVYCSQSEFTFDENDYGNIGKDAKRAVVFFSREGYTKKLAYEKADASGAKIIEIKTPERTKGFSGFMWCGRFGMHRAGMPIEQTGEEFSLYDEVTICAPIWVFSVCSPIREFCKRESGKIKKVNYCFVHFMKKDFLGSADELDGILKIKHDNLENVCCRFGKFKRKSSRLRKTDGK